MRFSNARQCIHDAFATHLTKPDASEIGGTRYSSNAAICHQVEAGQVIAAVYKLPEILKAACIYINAPSGFLNTHQIGLLQFELYKRWSKKAAHSPHVAAAMSIVRDLMLEDYRVRAVNHQRTEVNYHALLGQRIYTQAVADQKNIMLDILVNIDRDSLQPVWALIHNQRDAREQERLACEA